MWARGSAHLDGNGIVLRREDAEDYAFFEEDRLDKLVLDVAGLRSIGTLTDSEQLDPPTCPGLCERHGLLWHGPEQLASGECREPLRSLYFEGEELTLSIALYMLLREATNTSSAQPLHQYLWRLRDVGIFWGAMPQDPEELLNGLSTS